MAGTALSSLSSIPFHSVPSYPILSCPAPCPAGSSPGSSQAHSSAPRSSWVSMRAVSDCPRSCGSQDRPLPAPWSSSRPPGRGGLRAYQPPARPPPPALPRTPTPDTTPRPAMELPALGEPRCSSPTNTFLGASVPGAFLLFWGLGNDECHGFAAESSAVECGVRLDL